MTDKSRYSEKELALFAALNVDIPWAEKHQVTPEFAKSTLDMFFSTNHEASLADLVLNFLNILNSEKDRFFKPEEFDNLIQLKAPSVHVEKAVSKIDDPDIFDISDVSVQQMFPDALHWTELMNGLQVRIICPSDGEEIETTLRSRPNGSYSFVDGEGNTCYLVNDC